MTALLQTKAFHKIPPANIQAVFMRLNRVDYRAGEVVIKQGDVGDYFYVVVKGRCIVTRETPLNKEGVRLAELKMGDTFGDGDLYGVATSFFFGAYFLAVRRARRVYGSGRTLFLSSLNEPQQKREHAKA